MNTNVQLTDTQQPQNPILSDSSDLFDSPASWAATPLAAFESWISRQPAENSTREVRTWMWGKFLRYLDQIETPLNKVAARDVTRFIAEEKLEKEHGWRYIKLIERVYSHLIAIGFTTSNPGLIAGREGINNRANDPTRFLDREERERLEKHIRLVLLRAGGEFAAVRREREKRKKEYAQLWAEMRDAAIVAALYGAGVKVSEVERLSVSCTSGVDSNGGTLVLPRSGFDLERRIPCLAIGGYALSAWLPVRLTEADLGKPLFPALTSRRRADQLQQTAKMHHASVYRRVKAFLSEAGIVGARASGQTLRNSYAAALIESGLPNDEIAQALGFTGDFSMLHLRKEHSDYFGR